MATEPEGIQATGEGDWIKVKKAEYDKLVAQEKKLKDIENVYAAFQEKEQEVKLLNEKYSSCSRALIHTERQSARYLDLLLKKNVTGSSLEKDANGTQKPSVSDQQKRILDQMDSADVRCKTVENIEPSHKLLPRSTSTLEPDHAVIIPQQILSDPYPTRAAAKTFPEADKPKSGGSQEVVPAVERVTLNSDDLQEDGATCSPNEKRVLIEAAKAELSADETETAIGFLSGDSLGMSKDLLEKVTSQNARLKKVLRQIVDAQGLKLHEFLEKCQYVEIVEKQKEEINALQGLVGKQRDLLAASDSEAAASCVKLLDELHKMERTATLRQAVIDVYSAECVRLQQQLKLSTQGGTQPVGSDATDSNEKLSTEVHKDFSQLKETYGKMESFYKVRVDQLKSQLTQKTQTVEQLESEKKKLTEQLSQRWAKQYEPTACGMSERDQLPWRTQLSRTGLLVDGDESETPSGTATSGGVAEGPGEGPDVSDSTAQKDAFVCPRCHKKCDDKTQFEKHTERCMD